MLPVTAGPRRLIPRLSRTQMICLAFIAGFNSCRPPREGATENAYVDQNGTPWAFGAVQLADLDAPGSVMLTRQASDQSLNTATPGTSGYKLIGAIRAATGDGGIRDLVYVDYDDLVPRQNKLLAYSSRLDTRPSPKQAGVVDIYVTLLRNGLSKKERWVYIGSAFFARGATSAAVQLDKDLKLSLIADGIFSGQWALHFPDVPKVVVRPWQGICPKNVTQMPGQNPSQNPGQFEACRALPAQQDLCSGDPTKEGCRPAPPVQQPVVQQAPPAPGEPAPPVQAPVAAETAGLTVLSSDQQVFVMEADVKEAKIIFAAQTLSTPSEEANAAECARKFYAVARTVGRQVNTACVLKPAPTSPKDGRLTCALTVGFNQAETYLERVCEVVATFRGATDEIQRIQVLKK